MRRSYYKSISHGCPEWPLEWDFGAGAQKWAHTWHPKSLLAMGHAQSFVRQPRDGLDPSDFTRVRLPCRLIDPRVLPNLHSSPRASPCSSAQYAADTIVATCSTRAVVAVSGRGGTSTLFLPASAMLPHLRPIAHVLLLFH
jgi:hypothetical protein